MSDTKNVKLGVCSVSFGGTDLGYTKGGVDVEVKTQTKQVMVDQFGNSPINEYILSRTCTAKVPLAETTLQNLAKIMPGATLVQDGGTKASATATFANAAPVDGDKVAFNGVAYTFRTAGGPLVTDISLVGVTTAAQAASAFATAINASTNPLVEEASASVAGAVVTLAADDFGAAANAWTLTKTFATAANCSVTAFTGGTDSTKAKVVVPNGVGISLLSLAQALVLHPEALPFEDRSEDFTIPLAMTAGDMNYSYKLDQERIFTCSFTAYPDPVSKTLFIAGDSSAV